MFKTMGIRQVHIGREYKERENLNIHPCLETTMKREH